MKSQGKFCKKLVSILTRYKNKKGSFRSLFRITHKLRLLKIIQAHKNIRMIFLRVSPEGVEGRSLRQGGEDTRSAGVLYARRSEDGPRQRSRLDDFQRPSSARISQPYFSSFASPIPWIPLSSLRFLGFLRANCFKV